MTHHTMVMGDFNISVDTHYIGGHTIGEKILHRSDDRQAHCTISMKELMLANNMYAATTFGQRPGLLTETPRNPQEPPPHTDRLRLRTLGHRVRLEDPGRQDGAH